FEVPLKSSFVGQDLKRGDAMVLFEAKVVDPAGYRQVKQSPVTVTTRPIRTEVFPESGNLALNVENVVYIVTAYPDGRPAKTKIKVGSQAEVIETSELGIAKVKITPNKQQLQLSIRAEDETGLVANTTHRLRIGDAHHNFLLRTDRSVYRQGETANIEVLAGAGMNRIFLDVVKNRKTFLMKSVEIVEGRGEVALDLPLDLMGTLELHAYRIMPDGQIVEDTKLIQVHRADALAVEATLDRDSYKPAEKAIIEFAVKDEKGAPAQAALSLAAVDEAVFALNDARPGLEAIYFLLQEEILKPRYQMEAQPPINFKDTFYAPPEPEPDWQEAEVVLFAGSEGDDKPKMNHGQSFEEKQAVVVQEKKDYGDRTMTGVGLIPLGIFVVLVLGVFSYVVLKLRKAIPLSGLYEKEIGEIRSRARWLFWTAVGSVYVPVACMMLLIFAHEVLHVPMRDEWAGIWMLASMGFMLVLMLIACLRLRSYEPVRALPAFRKAA
ncbi:MAG: hypothetical protein AAF492_21805, partial [Verrucomicrobiota bacterium]